MVPEVYRELFAAIAAGYALIASVLAGVARAWELVGERDTGIWASLSVLTGRRRDLDHGSD